MVLLLYLFSKPKLFNYKYNLIQLLNNLAKQLEISLSFFYIDTKMTKEDLYKIHYHCMKYPILICSVLFTNKVRINLKSEAAKNDK